MALVAGLLGVMFALGVVTLVVALRPVAVDEIPERRAEGPPLKDRFENLVLRLALGVSLAVVVGVVTRWPMAALIMGAAGFLAPSLLGGEAQRKAQLDRVEGVAAWAEMLRDTMAGSGGLEQSIIATAGVAPVTIRPEVIRLAARLERERLAPALRVFADELDDPSGDLVVAALLLAADKSPKRLGDLLGRLAHSAREEVNMRLRIDAGRARTRTSVKVITIATVVFAALLVVLGGDYLDAYDTFTGQLVIAVIGACFATSFSWLSRAFKIDTSTRFLRTDGAGS
jgi:tight adherence protein B